MPAKFTPKKSVSVRSVANKALSLARKAVSTEETKFTDIATTVSTIDSTADAVHLTPLLQGLDRNHRIGNKVTAVGFQVNYWIARNASATNTQVRLCLVQDMQQIADATTISWTSVFSEEFVGSQRTNNKRYRIIYDKTHKLDSGSTVTSLVKKFVPYKHPVYYNGTAAADIQKNGVYLLVLSNEVSNGASLNYTIRYLFKDA